MKAENFVYWLQGFFELGEPKTLDERQVQLIKNHLNMVFVHDIDPQLGNEEHLRRITAAHSGHPIEHYERSTAVFNC